MRPLFSQSTILLISEKKCKIPLMNDKQNNTIHLGKLGLIFFSDQMKKVAFRTESGRGASMMHGILS